MLNRAEREAQFRRHATAVIRGEYVEAERLLEPLYPREFLGHFVFVFALFASVVVEQFGEELERPALEAFGVRLRERWPGVSSLKCEAMIRVVYGEHQFFAEIPQVDHLDLMWTVTCGLVASDTGEAELSGLFDRADGTAKDFVRAVFASETLASWRDDADLKPDREEQVSAGRGVDDPVGKPDGNGPSCGEGVDR